MQSRKKILLLFLLGSFAFFVSCAGIENRPKTEEAAPVAVPEAKAPPREPGSLWSEDSTWNHLYSVSTFRSVGSFVFIKPSERLVSLIETKIEREKEKASRDKDKDKKKLTDAQKKIAKKKETKKGKEKRDVSELPVIVATIQESHPRGIYSVVAEQRMDIEGEEHQIILEGKIRDKAIEEDDTVSSDVLFDMVLKIPTATVVLPEVADDKEDPKKGPKSAKAQRKKGVGKADEEKDKEADKNQEKEKDKDKDKVKDKDKDNESAAAANEEKAKETASASEEESPKEEG